MSNRALALKCIRNAPLSRTDIAKELNLAKSAITKITNELIDEGLIYEKTTIASLQGRKPTPLDIVSDARYAIGVSLSRQVISVCTSNLKLSLHSLRQMPVKAFTDTQSALDWIFSVIDSIISSPEYPLEKCLGIGIGSLGPLDYRKGMIFVPSDMKLFHNINIVSTFKERYSVPIQLENISLLLGLAEYSRGTMKNFSNSMFVSIRNGIGAAIIQNGQIYRGFSGAGAEIGHMCVDPFGPKCDCGGIGCLEKYITLDAIKKRFGFDDYSKVVDDAMNNEPYALDILIYLSKYLGSAFVNAVNLMDLDSIVISGEYSYKPSLLIEKISKNVHEHSLVCRVHKVAIMNSALGDDAFPIASVSGIMSAFYNQEL